MSKKSRIILIILVITFISIISWIGFHFRYNITIPDLIIGEKDEPKLAGIFVSCPVTGGIDGKTLSIRMLIPCSDLQQKYEIQKKLPKIQHGFIMCIDNPNMENAIRERDFYLMKEIFLSKLNGISSKPVKTLYFENYFIN